MKKITLLFIVIAWCSSLTAQQSGGRLLLYMSFQEATSRHQMQLCQVADSTVIDTVALQVDYRYEFTRNSKPLFATIRLEKGASCVKQTDMALYYSGIHLSVWNEPNKRGYADSLLKWMGQYGGCSDIFLEMTYIPRDDLMTIVCGNFFLNNAPFTYRESRPKIDWTLTDRVDTLLGYTCNTAKTRFRGRDWNVWYTPEISVSLGPWKLSGLPGLILRAETEGFKFESVAIRQPENKPIYQNRYEGSKQHFKTREKYAQYERSCFEDPVTAVSRGEPVPIAVKNQSGGVTILDENSEWKIPYNPLEKE